MTHSKTFTDEGTHRAFNAARIWLETRGFSVGRMQAHQPCGILFGDYDIQKWRNLNTAERTALDGVLTGNFRDGPVVARLLPAASDGAVKAFTRKAEAFQVGED